MKEYDVIVIGAGVGLNIVFKAVSQGFKVALVDKGPLGGTCLNVGCVPSKMLIYPADVIREIEGARKFGIHAEITSIDFNAIMERMRRTVGEGRGHLRGVIEGTENLDLYEGEGRFIGEYTVEVNKEEIRGRKIFIASGARPIVPPVKGIDTIGYLTNETVIELRSKPESIIIIGGGYIATEYGHFFAAMGTKVRVLQRNERLLPNEEPEISDLLRREMEKRMEIFTSVDVLEVSKHNQGCRALVRDRKSGQEMEVLGERLFVATGRESNADSLAVKNAGVETDEKNFIRVDEYLQTSKENIWAVGDAQGRQMFTHSGDAEADLAWHNATQEPRRGMNFNTVPHAVFTYPQIASVGLTEEKARKDYDILVGKAHYSDVVKGEAMMEEEGFAKAIVEKKTGRIIGFHIVGPQASILLQEVINAMAHPAGVKSITESIHIFPSLSEVITETLSNLDES